MTVDRTPKPCDRCTCGPGVWGACDYCGTEAWVSHRCPRPCDDATCEGGLVCVGCLGRPCPVHNGPDDDWDDDEYDPAEGYGDLLAAIRGVINRWADDDSIDDQAARLVGELLVVMHESGWR